MLTVRRPAKADVARYLLSRKDSPFTYQSLGITKSFIGNAATLDGISRFDVDRERLLLGFGAATFQAARTALCQWEMFPASLTQLYWPDRAIQLGANVAVLFRAGPIWSLNPCRIVYVIDDPSSSNSEQRFGFAYGTLEGHLESGEEMFSVCWNPDDDSVHYELLAVSRPNHILTRIGYAYARIVQARFRRLSAAAMKVAVDSLRTGLSLEPAPPCDSTSLCGGAGR